MNLTLLSTEIVTYIRNSVDTSLEQAQCVEHLIREAIAPMESELGKIKLVLADPADVWVNMLCGTIAMPQAVEHGRQCQQELEQIQNALDRYWREHPTTLAAVQSVMKDVNELRGLPEPSAEESKRTISKWMDEAPSWRCSCGQRCVPHSHEWRWSGCAWQHHHPEAFCHFDATRIEPHGNECICPTCGLRHGGALPKAGELEF